MKDDAPLLILLAGFLAFFGLRTKIQAANESLPIAPIPILLSPFLSAPMTTTLDTLYKKHANQKGLDWRLVKAHAIVESSENPSAKNPADPSYGLMQVLCRASCSGCQCTNKFNINGWDEATPERLYEPDFNLHIATQIMRWNSDTYGFLKGIAIYNNYSARFDPDNGPFRNQSYVDKVLREWHALGGAGSQV